MGNRILKESIRTSKKINSLTDFQFRVWAYLVTYVDDYGRGSADAELLKGFVFPRRRGITEQQIAKTLAELATSGMISLYEVDGESFFCFPTWGEHQRVQQKRSKFPAPREDAQSHGGSRWVTVTHRLNPNPNPYPNTNPYPKGERARPREAASPRPSRAQNVENSVENSRMRRSAVKQTRDCPPSPLPCAPKLTSGCATRPSAGRTTARRGGVTLSAPLPRRRDNTGIQRWRL